MKKVSLLLAVVMFVACTSVFVTSCKQDGKERKKRETTETERESPPTLADTTSDYASEAKKFQYMNTETVTFGSYHGEDIEWLVLEKGSEGTLLLSKYVLDYQTYDDPDDPCKSWMTSRLDPWLNEEFFNEAFSEEEQAKILWKEIPITDYDKAYSDYDDELYREPALDRVFLLSLDELAVYYPAKLDTCYCEATTYAVSLGAPRENCDWWLRGPCEITRFDNGDVETGKPAASAECKPQEGDAFLYFSDLPCGIRPAIWVDLDGTVENTIAPSDWIAEVSCETAVTADGMYSYKLYSGSDYETTIVMDVNVDDYLLSDRFELGRLLNDNGWQFCDSNGNPVEYTKNADVSGAWRRANGIETHFGFAFVSGYQLCGFSLDFKKPGDGYYELEDYYRNDPDIAGNYEHYTPLVCFEDHNTEYIVENFGYDGAGELRDSLSYNDIVLITYAISFASKDENAGKNPFYYTDIEGGESLWYSMVYDLP